ncbi:hypothetical protein DID88_005510 [Monilinia fructigena]|uniref:Uncharacterized protein n=1 Tax=Monilinia fructigena TaxID=38457 RepID=A0A395J007_9HELO|nr:hypothetical protein DID88_005510 [Monilinia fructigena]
MAPTTRLEDEVGTEDEEFEGRPDKIKALLADDVVSISDNDDTGSESKPSNFGNKGKRKAIEQVEWSDDERAKGVKEAREKGESSKSKERTWDDESDDEMDDEIPEYLQVRRREFDTKLEKMKNAGLQLPPDFSDISFSDDERLAELEERPDFPSTVEPSRPYADINMELSNGVIPASIAQYLRDYQVDGVKFLHEKFVYQKGGILGDDMGLGKTVQAAAFLTAAFGKTGDERDGKRMRKVKRTDENRWYPRVLIVCPGSLIQNWKNELMRWGWWHVEKFHGDAKEKDSVLRSAQSGRVEIVITTYATYKNHKDDLNTISWDCVVADECHQLKERTSATTQAMNEVNALCRIGLTGTAIQNKYEELWTLLNWVCPGQTGSRDCEEAMVFPIMTTLQKLSNHLALLLPNDGDPREKQERDLDFLQKMLPDRWEELYKARDSIANLSNPEFCGKWKVLKKLLKHWHEEGDKVLIFSHSVKLLRMLQHLFQSTSYNVSFLSGEMKYEDRQDTVDDFNSDPNQFIFLISTKAGGVGLNITSANKVVIFDPNWNPSYDLQAQDRAYRIGQLRDVDSFRLVSAGTIEEVVYARQIYKQQQANIGYNASMERRYFKGVQNAVGQKGEIFGLDNLLSFHADEILLRDIVNKTNVAETRADVAMASFDVQAALDDDDNPLRVDDDDPNGAMSQLAALITESEKDTKRKQKSTPKSDPIAAILAFAGVEYTHENSEVVGSSKVEERLSHRAEETGGEIGYGEEVLFASHRQGGNGNGNIQYVFRPPENVMRRQFCTMAKTFGFASATEFAFVVRGWTQKQRTNFFGKILPEKEGEFGRAGT